MKYTTYKSLYQLTAFSPLFPINAYIFEEQASLTVIDVGLNVFVKHIEKLARKLDKPIKFIILTHPHLDHIAGLDLLKKQFPEAKIVFSKRDTRLLNGDFSLDSTEFQGKIRGGFKEVETRPDIMVDEHDEIGSLKVINTPGHTPGSISLYDSSHKIIITGDAFQTKGGLAIAGDKRKFFPFPAFATWSKQTALQSAEKIAHLQIDCLATGHGKLLMNPDFKPAIRRLDNKISEEKN